MSVVGGVGGTARGGQSDAGVGDEDGEAGHRNAVVAAVADPSRRIGDLGRLRRDKRHATGGGRKAGGAKDSDNEEVCNRE